MRGSADLGALSSPEVVSRAPDRARALWLAAGLLVLLALPLVFANALHEPLRGHNEEVGFALALAGAFLALVGVALRRARGWEARLVGALALAVLLAPVVWAVVVASTVPDFDAQRTLAWERLPEAPEGAPVVDAQDWPSSLREALAATAPGDASYHALPREDAIRVWDEVAKASPEEHVVVIGEGAYRFLPMAVP